MCWRHCVTLSWWHTHCFGQWEGAWGACEQSGAATEGIMSRLQCREVSIPSFGCVLPGVCYHSRWSWHWIGQDVHTWGQADTEFTWWCPGASQVHELLPKIHLEIWQGVRSTDGITKHTWEITCSPERDRFSQMRMDAVSRSGILDYEKDVHGDPDPPALQSGRADHSPNWFEWIWDCNQPQPVRCCLGSQTGQCVL